MWSVASNSLMSSTPQQKGCIYLAESGCTIYEAGGPHVLQSVIRKDAGQLVQIKSRPFPAAFRRERAEEMNPMLAAGRRLTKGETA